MRALSSCAWLAFGLFIYLPNGVSLAVFVQQGVYYILNLALTLDTAPSCKLLEYSST